MPILVLRLFELFKNYFDGFVQECSISIANTLEIL